MDTKFKILHKLNETVEADIQRSQLILETLSSLGVLVESVTQVLANIATKVSNNENITLASIDSLSSFLAGVEAITTQLPNSTDETKKQNVVRLLSLVGVNSDGTLTTTATPIAEYGARYPDIRSKYTKLFQQYENSLQNNQPNNGQLVSIIRSLQLSIDKAVTIASRNPKMR